MLYYIFDNLILLVINLHIFDLNTHNHHFLILSKFLINPLAFLLSNNNLILYYHLLDLEIIMNFSSLVMHILLILFIILNHIADEIISFYIINYLFILTHIIFILYPFLLYSFFISFFKRQNL
jgi:hypothetical protein